MLSVENPSDPLVSCKASALKSDESASDKLAFQEAADPEGLDEAKPPHFSIRDYVFNSRRKDVTKNWPFPHKFLQLCLEYGVKDILPPFEPPDLVRAQRCRRGAEYEQPITCSNSERISAEFKSLEPKNGGQIIDEEPNIIRHELCLPLDQFVVEYCPDQAQDLFSKSRKSKVNHKILSGDELITTEAEPISTITSHDQIERVSGQIRKLPSTVNATKSATEGSSELEVDERPLLPEKFEVRREASEKKCKLIVKLSSTSEATRVEDIVSTSSTVSDPMASKVCPVCKTFTSTSNTTLNAHIDQCLSQESNTKRAVTKLSKLKVKPRKKRLMVDIYTTAPHCTLEDLDIRNGTSWATDVTLAAPTSEFRTETKRARLSMSGATNDGNEGAVYVDSNGMKLRILSKFNDVPPVISDDFKLRKHVKGIKAGRSSLISKKKCFKPKYSKCMKINQRNKRLRSFKLFKGKSQVTQIEDCHSNTYKEKEESLSCILNAQDQVKCHNPGTLRPQVCSKRSGPSRKLNKKGNLRNIENTAPSTMDTFVEGETSVEGSQPNRANSSVVERHILKLSSSSEDLPSSPKTKRVDVLSNSVHATYIGKARPPKPLESNSRLSPENISLASGLLPPKLPRASSNFVSSPRSKREEIHLSTIHKSDSSSDITTTSAKSYLPSAKTRNRFTPKKNVSLGKSSTVVVSKSDDSEKRLTARMFRKHRSMLGVGNRRGKLPSGINGELHGSTKDFGFEYSPRANGTGNAYQPNFPEDITISRFLESEQEKEGFCTMAKHESAKKKMLLGADCCAFDVEASDMQHEPLGCEDIANEHSMDKDADEHGGGANLIVKHSTPAFSAGVDPWQSGQEHAESFCVSEAPVEGGLIDKQVMQCYDVASNKIINKNIEKVDEEGNLFRVTQSEDQTNTSVEGFSTCLIGHVDMVLESAQKNSSITSVKMASSEDHNFSGCIETSAAPASTSSNFSLPSPEVSKSKNSYEEQFVELTAGQGKLSSCLLDNTELPSIVSIRGTEGGKKERRHQEVKGVAMAKELEKLSDDQLCCCSRKERFSQESPQLLRKSSKTNSMLPSKGKHVTSNLCIRPIISSSSSALHSLSTGEMSVPILESSTESILIKVPSDFASELPPGSDFGPSSPYSLGQDQAVSNPILRLMGKDLVVKNKELAELPEVFPPDSDYASTMKYVPLGFTSSNSGLGKISFSHQQCQIPSGSTIFSKASSKAKHQTSGFVGVSSMKSQQKRAKKLHSPLPCSIEKMVASQHHQRPISTAPAPYRDVIVIDGSPDVEAKVNRSIPSPVVALPPAFPGSNLIPPRLFSCFPTKNTDMSGEVPGMVKPSYSISYTMANACTPVKHDSASEGSVPPSSFVFQPLSGAHLTPSLYSSQTLQ